MPKSISSIQLQVTGCEQAIQQAIDLFVYMADGQDVQYSVNLQDFIQNISTLNVKAVHSDITKDNNMKKILVNNILFSNILCVFFCIFFFFLYLHDSIVDTNLIWLNPNSFQISYPQMELWLIHLFWI